MAYNIVEIAFFAAALHVGDPRENLLDETVDYLCAQNKIAEEYLDITEEFAETLVELITADNTLSSFDILGHVLNAETDSVTVRELKARRDTIIKESRNCLKDIAFDKNEPDDIEEYENTEQTIVLAQEAFNDIASDLSNREMTDLVTACENLEDISAMESLHTYYSRMKAHPFMASE